MRVISKSRLREFWETPGHEDSETALLAWHKVVSNPDLSWSCFADVKATYATASIYEDCVVFNIGGNKYRLIARIRYPYKVFVVAVLTHSEYDKESWKDSCRCTSRHAAGTIHQEASKSGKVARRH